MHRFFMAYSESSVEASGSQETETIGQWSVSTSSLSLLESLGEDVAVLRAVVSELKYEIKKDIKPILTQYLPLQTFADRTQENVKTMEEKLNALEIKVKEMDEKMKLINEKLQAEENDPSDSQPHQNTDTTLLLIQELKAFIQVQHRRCNRDSGVPDSPYVGPKEFDYQLPLDLPPSKARDRHSSISENGPPSNTGTQRHSSISKNGPPSTSEPPAVNRRQRSHSINQVPVYLTCQSLYQFLDEFESRHYRH